MKNSYIRQNNFKTILYAVCVIAIFGICAVILQDIKIPTEHVSQNIEVTVED